MVTHLCLIACPPASRVFAWLAPHSGRQVTANTRDGFCRSAALFNFVFCSAFTGIMLGHGAGGQSML